MLENRITSAGDHFVLLEIPAWSHGQTSSQRMSFSAAVLLSHLIVV